MTETKKLAARMIARLKANPRIAALIAALIVTMAALVVTTIALVKKTGHQPNAQASTQKKALYRCPMHPSVTSDHPDNCPVCHMALQKVDDDEMGENTGSTDSAALEGRQGFSLSHEKQQLIGVTTATVEVRPMSLDVRASGRVAYDPELFTAIEEYRQALISNKKMSTSEHGGLREQSAELIRSAKTKLRLMGLTNAQIDQLAGRSDAMDLILPRGSVWIYAEVFEYEISGVKAGQKVEVTSPSFPGKTFSGKLTSLSPILNSQTRTIRVRAQVPDPEGILRPDTFVNVKIKIDVGSKLSVPENSVLHSGEQDFVFVAKGNGRFEPRAVSIGHKTREYVEVLDGLESGETVVTAANFLIDSESRLRAAIQHMGSGASQPATAQTPSGAHEGHGR